MVRSVAMTYQLKQYGIDTLACGVKGNSAETLEMLYQWADRIFLVEKWMEMHVPTGYHPKCIVLELGPDRWQTPMHPELQALVDNLLRQVITVTPLEPAGME